MNEFTLPHGLTFPDLYDDPGLARIDELFRAGLAAADPDLAERLDAARAAPDLLERKAESELLILLAPHLEEFLAELFAIRAPVAALAAQHHALAPLYTCKRLFVQRLALRAHKAAAVAGLDPKPLEAALATRIGAELTDLAFARAVLAWLDAEAEHEEDLALAARYAAWATLTEAGRRRWRTSVLFRTPHKIDPYRLIELRTVERGGVAMLDLPEERRRHREGFGLTDAGADLVHALDQVHYCIFCHHQGKDSCARGLQEKDGTFRKTVFGVTLAGCPLEEKISEMHELKAAGRPLGALAMVAVDNPLCAATGHRICNDCMKACIYQKQEPVDIPQAETRVLKDVLALPWGFEIYGLLTRWNPLNLRRPVARPASGRRVLVAGLGPAGFTLAHFLLNDGHTVFAVDGLKIEPIAADLSGVDAAGNRVPFRPVRDIADLIEPLDDRIMAGFGGVAEYGITVRWDKNFLKIVRLLLERRARFAMAGGVRLGGTITLPQSFDALGFDHVALCMGAGRPTVIDMPNGLAPGVRMASDFLMALQLTGAAKMQSLANLQLRLPVVVVGGGLTAIDTATEAMAYYPVQVEKFLRRHEILVAERGEGAVNSRWSASERAVAEEFLAHARAIRAERAAAAAQGRPARIQALIDGWGGVTIAYRRRLIDAPSYTLNHEEVAKALEEGIRFAEGLSPLAVEIDAAGRAAALRVKRERTVDGAAIADEMVLPARAVLVAAGTRPNTVLAREEPAELSVDGAFFQALDEAGDPVRPERVAKPSQPHVLTARRADGRTVSFFGDLHPSFSGNVVKAMGGVTQGWPVVARALARLEPAVRDESEAAFLAGTARRFRAKVKAVHRLTPTIVEVIVEAPQAAANFRPGLFYRLQNFEALAPYTAGTRLAMEGLALTGAAVDRKKGLVSLIVLEMGGSSDLCALLKPGEPVVLMGPTGTPTEIASGETVLLAGGGLGNAVLFSIGRGFRAAGSRVLYFAGYRRLRDRYKVEEIEAAADVVVWASDEAPGFAPGRPQDRSVVGTIIEAMAAYQRGALGPKPIDLGEIDRVMAIGSEGMMAAVAEARTTVLAPWLKPGHRAIGSINSPMQCMMKEICAQCLQTQIDPESGAKRVVFSCFNQDQPLDAVAFPVLRDRLSQNSVQEKLTALWVDRCLVQLGSRQATAAE
jgi:NADPH-dependent glutamate synthase beta subunit-like oxidoreductase/NAD(P)H-flavin reductase